MINRFMIVNDPYMTVENTVKKKHVAKFKGGPGSGDFGHAGRPGLVGGSSDNGSNISVQDIKDALSVIRSLTISGGDVGELELSSNAKKFLHRTVDTNKQYKLYRGIGLINDRYDLNKARKLNPGDKLPADLMKEGNNYASYTTKKSVAREYSEGTVSIISSVTVSHENILADLSNIRNVVKAAEIEFDTKLDQFDENDYDYFNDYKEVIVVEPVKASVYYIKKEYFAKFKGGTNSGYRGYAGRPGKLGGSAASNAFDETKTGMPFYDNMINNVEYYKKNKHLTFEIQHVSPDEYIAMSAARRGIVTSIEEETRIVDWDKVDKYAAAMKNGDKFPMLFIGETEGSQEGRHRALAAKQIGIRKVPVMIVTKV